MGQSVPAVVSGVKFVSSSRIQSYVHFCSWHVRLEQLHNHLKNFGVFGITCCRELLSGFIDVPKEDARAVHRTVSTKLKDQSPCSVSLYRLMSEMM